MSRTFYLLTFWGLLLLSAHAGRAQTDPQFSLFMFNQTYYNPAAAGSEGVARFNLTHRTQWAGYQGTADDGGAPSTQLLSFNTPLPQIKSGVGLYAFNDNLGPNTNQSVQVSYAYRAALKNGTLSFGLQGGFYSQAIDFSRLRSRDPNDPLIPTGRLSKTQPDVGAGIYYNTTDYWIGVSMKHINQPSFEFISNRDLQSLRRSTFVTAGYRLGVGYNLDIQPSVLYQYANEAGMRASSLNVNLLATYDKRYWAGVSYRQGDAATAMLGISLLQNNALRFGYAFDFTTTAPQAKSPQSHEILLSYALPSPDARKKPIIRTPRFRY